MKISLQNLGKAEKLKKHFKRLGIQGGLRQAKCPINLTRGCTPKSFKSYNSFPLLTLTFESAKLSEYDSLDVTVHTNDVIDQV